MRLKEGETMSRLITRRVTVAGIAAASTVRPARADLAALEEAARKEGSLTWYTAQMSGEAAEDIGRIFTRKYPAISVTLIRTTGQVAYQRVLQELKNRTPQCDVFCSTDNSHYPALKARGALAEYKPQNAGALAPQFVGLGDSSYYVPATASLQVMVYHTKNVKPEDVPRNWTDLIDPKWKGRVAVAHPAFSGYFGQWTVAMRKLYGWEFFEKLAKQNPRIGRSGNDPIAMLNAGESLIGTGPVSTSVQNIEKGNPIGFLYPKDGTLLCFGPASVMAAAPHPNAARLFLEWMLSEDYAKACVKWHLEPVRADAPQMEGTKRLSDINLIRLTEPEIAKGMPEVIESWRDTFGS
jgi:iron(III) transport system substrate-binding protein